MSASLRPMLDGRVFHVSRLKNLPAILQAGEIKANVDGSLATSFGFSKNSFFRNRGCVSVFDLRTGTREELDDGLSRCSPVRPAQPGGGIAIFFLGAAACAKLLSWRLWKDEEAWREMVVPYVEAGHKGAIPLAHVDEIVRVEVEEDPNSLAATVRRAMATRSDETASG